MKINLLIGACLLAMSMFSCDYLDVVPKGKFVVENVEEYLEMLEDGNPNIGIDNFGLVSNEKTWFNVNSVLNYDTPDRSANLLWDESVDRSQYYASDEIYGKIYKRIAICNIVLDGLSDANGSEADKTLAASQARTFRAFYHFFLVNTYAKPYDPATAASDRGIILQEDFDMESTRPQSSVADAYASIERDLSDDVIAGLPDRPKNVLLPGKAFACALRAKVALFKRDHETALKYALKALDYGNSLMDLVALEATKTALGGYGAMVTIPIDNAESLLHLFGSVQNIAGPTNHLNPETYSMFDEGDARKSLLFESNRSNPPTMEAGSAVCWNGSQYNVNGIRLAEVYLMIAEAYARGGSAADLTNAMKYLNALREKRIKKENYTLLLADTKEKAMALIKKERATELVFTCNRFFDVRRFAAEEKQTLRKNFGGTEYTLAPDSHLLIFPFPQEAFVGNPFLQQNSK